MLKVNHSTGGIPEITWDANYSTRGMVEITQDANYFSLSGFKHPSIVE